LKSFPEPAPEEELTKSTAKSGSYFYKTRDEKYFIKTLLYPEVSALMEILKSYHKHLAAYPKTFLVRIYGMWRIKDFGRDEFWVIVMRNTFPPGIKMDEIYDLKGRKAKPGAKPGAKHSEGEIKTDYEYIPILFHEEDKPFYLNQLRHDVELLRAHKMMDYSLLMGIQQPQQTQLQGNDCPNFSLRGIPLSNSNHLTPTTQYKHIWINIIDILTVYNTQKKLANLFKTTLFERESLSTVDSEFYSTRFFSFMTRNLLTDEEETEQVLTPVQKRSVDIISTSVVTTTTTTTTTITPTNAIFHKTDL